MKFRLVYTLLFTIVFAQGFSQKKAKLFNAIGEENAIYAKEWSIGARFHSNGFGLFFEHVWIKDIKRRKLIQVAFFSYNDYRDKKSETIRKNSPKYRKYFYGRQNHFYALNILYGNRRVIANKSEISGVKLSVVYMGGITLGVLKPYYLRFIPSGSNDLNKIMDKRYTGDNEDEFLGQNSSEYEIYGAGGFFRGFDKMSFAPGLQAKVGLNFDFARKNNFVTSLEVGTQIDVFYKKINIYVSDKNKPYIWNVYLSIQLGKRS